MKNINDFKDFKGFLVQKKYASAVKYNAVDSNFLNSNYLYQKLLVEPDQKTRDHAHKFIKMYQNQLGTLRRYYKTESMREDGEDQLWTNPNTVSRDNSMGFIVLAGYLDRRDVVRQFAINTIKRGSFFQNKITNKGEKKIVPDFCGPSQWSTIVRSCFKDNILLFLYPLLLVLDFFFMLSLIWDVLYSYYHPKETSTVFHTVSAIYQKKFTLQTPFSMIGSYIYMGYRCPIKEYQGHRIVTCLKYYSRVSYDPPIYEQTRVLINKEPI